MKKILIVDDSAVFRKVVAMHLKTQGYEVIEAGDGLEAMDKLKNDQVNLIVCDVNMPNMDGLTFISKLRTDNQINKFTPIIMLTTESQEEKKRQGMEAGAKAWLVKPVAPEQLLMAISKLIK